MKFPLRLNRSYLRRLTILLLSLLLGVSFLVIYKSRVALNHVLHSHAIQENLQSIFSLLQEAESGQRGYLLTGEDDYLEPYEQSLHELTQQLQRFQSFIDRDPLHSKNFDLLLPLISEKTTELRHSIDLRKRDGLLSAVRSVQTNHGKRVMDKIRAVVDEIAAVENDRLAERKKDWNTQISWFSIFLGSIVVLLANFGWHLALQTERLARRGLALIRNMRNLRMKKASVRLLLRVSTSANEAHRLQDALAITLEEVCRHMGWEVGHALVLSEADGLLHSAGWHIQSFEKFNRFKVETEHLTFGSGVGLPGAVLASGNPLWVQNITEAPDTIRRIPAQQTGLKAACVFPIRVEKTVVGVLEFFSDKTIQPNEELLQIMVQVGTQLGRIVERQRAEADMLSSLNEKEVLLKEVHHRVKNNLQILSSLLRMQSQKIERPEDRALFVQSQNRIHTMALIHELLYKSSDLRHVRMGPYLRTLVSYLSGSYGSSLSTIRVDVQVKDVPVTLDVAICTGLIVTELVSNAFKHAFPSGRAGTIAVEFAQEGETHYQLTVQDDGKGLSSETTENDVPRSLGFRIVNALARQLGGKLDIESASGTRFQVRFPVPKSESAPPLPTFHSPL